MKKEKVENLLLEAKAYRKQGLFAEALSDLHQIVNIDPENDKYKYLLASTYLEADNEESAEQYALEIINRNESHKESLELLGVIREKEKKYTEAEIYFKKALLIDPEFHNARMNLLKLYDKHIINYEAMEKNCKYLLTHRDIDRDNYPERKKRKILLDWVAVVYARLKAALVKQAKFNDAIISTKEYIAFTLSADKKLTVMHLINEYDDIYKYYYLMKDTENLEKYKKEYAEIFSMFTPIEIEENFIQLEEFVNKGWF
jgi:tetratricopeptide (TPR) repeat protein